MWWIVTGLVLVGAVCLIRSSYERRHIVTTVYSIGSKKLGPEWKGYRICFLTDLHNNTFGKKGLKLLEEKIAEAKPDLILIGGDMMKTSLHEMKDFAPVEEFVINLAEKYPVLYALGNHEKRMRDYTDYLGDTFQNYKKALEDAGVRWLENDSVELSMSSKTRETQICQESSLFSISKDNHSYENRKNTSKESTQLSEENILKNSHIRITGLDMDWCYYVCKGKVMQMVSGYMEKTLGKQSEDVFQILLPHSPLYLEEYGAWGADLTLAGHFHGGTIRLPFVGGVMSPQFQFFIGRDRGLYSLEESKMIVSGGLGTHSINLRLNNMSELVVVELDSL